MFNKPRKLPRRHHRSKFEYILLVMYLRDHTNRNFLPWLIKNKKEFDQALNDPAPYKWSSFEYKFIWECIQKSHLIPDKKTILEMTCQIQPALESFEVGAISDVLSKVYGETGDLDTEFLTKYGKTNRFDDAGYVTFAIEMMRLDNLTEHWQLGVDAIYNRMLYAKTVEDRVAAMNQVPFKVCPSQVDCNHSPRTILLSTWFLGGRK
jgi:hypothetical protein